MEVRNLLDLGEKHPIIVIIVIALTAASSWLFNQYDDDIVWIPVCAAFALSWLLYPSSQYTARFKILLPWAMVISLFIYAAIVYEDISIGVMVLGPILFLILSTHTIVVLAIRRTLSAEKKTQKLL